VDDYFDGLRISPLDKGFVFALAHIRGGGEFGLYAAGRRLDKINSVTDFLSCAHHLIDIRVADPERIVAHVSAADSGGCGSSRFKKGVVGLRIA
jgi:oligopeptidase B